VVGMKTRWSETLMCHDGIRFEAFLIFSIRQIAVLIDKGLVANPV
jgi:hypothetical protein